MAEPEPGTPERIRSAFSDISAAELEAERIHRMVVGVDRSPRPMSEEEVALELNDPFATLLLRRNVLPESVAEIISAVDAATAADDPLRTRMSFVVGEGTQIPWSADTATVGRGIRFALTFGLGDETDMLVSADRSGSGPGFLQVIGWDRTSGVFHFYERKDGRWIWAGNSTHALESPSRGLGPFDSHVNGSLVLKEFKLPWTHWRSFAATVDANVFAPDDPRRTDPLFTEASGAEVFETRVVAPGVRRWTESRFARQVSETTVEQADTILRQLFETTTVNLVSSAIESRLVESATKLELPPSFFLDTDVLVNGLGLPAPPDLSVSGEHYRSVLEEFDVALIDGEFRQPGDTHFAFLVPERAFEDIDVVSKCLEIDLLSKRFVGCALLVDFPNPIFSAQRASLLNSVPREAERTERLDEIIVGAIGQSAGVLGTAGGEFLVLWELGDGWRVEAEKRLAAYYESLVDRLATLDGVRDVFRLAESRRARVRRSDLSEGRPLLFATSILSENAELLEMAADATIRAAVI